MKGYYKSLKYLVYISQIGFSISTPIVVMAMLGNFINTKFNLGVWFTVFCIIFGTVSGFFSLIQTLNYISNKNKDSKDENKYE